MIISRYEMVLAANVLLASFIPMLMDTGGNAGSQSSVAVIRALTLKEVDFPDMLKIMWKETGVSLLTGVCVAGVNFFRVWLSNGDPMVALAVSLTLIVIIVSANIVGSALPLIAQKVGIDPALMASPLITTIVDAAAIFAFFNIAVMVIPGLAQ
jgi:magnesium transporter